MSDTLELNVWLGAKEAYHSHTNPFPTAAIEAAAAVIRSYGDQRDAAARTEGHAEGYAQAVADVVEWINSGAGPYVEGYGEEIATEITRRFGKGQDHG